MPRAISVALAIALIATIGTSVTASVPEGFTPTRSATKARDIAGFALGMHIRDVESQAVTKRIAWDDYQTSKGGIDYDLGLTRLGHIYRMSSTQHLGNFAIDDEFLRALSVKLTAKYGPPVETTAGLFRWSLIEPVKRTGGDTLPYETNRAYANVEGGPDGVTLKIDMIDYRIIWHDDAVLNRAPRDEAGRKLNF